MLIKYSVDEVVERAAKQISENSEITNFYPGGVARSIVEAISYIIGDSEDEEHYSIYRFLEQVLHQGYLSKATDEYLDLIGDLFSYKRREVTAYDEDGNEFIMPIDNDEYREEISQQVTVLMSSNETALKFNLLLVDGVRDVVTHEYMYGTGSFLFTIIEDKGFNSEDLLSECRDAIQKVKALGVRGEVELPEYVSVDLEIELFFRDNPEGVNRAGVRMKVEERIKEYIVSLYLGQSIVYNELVERIMGTSEDIYDFEVKKWTIAGEPVLLMNQTIDEEERFTIGDIHIL